MTTKELSYLNDLLNAEQIVIKKYRDYSQGCNDQQVQQLCNQLASQHQKHYDQIFQQLNSF